MRALTLLALWASAASAVAVARREPEATNRNLGQWGYGHHDQVVIYGDEAKVGDFDSSDHFFEDDSDLSSSDDDDYEVDE